VTAATVVLEWTVLRCRGPHPYASRLPEKFGGRRHDAPIGLAVPFRCLASGRVWTPASYQATPSLNDRLLIHVRCWCGTVTEYEIVRSDA
jgi:hypothetical protein